MTKRDPALVKAERLRAIVNMPEYADTIGAWIDDAHKDALHLMTTAKEPAEFHAAQGAYKAIDALKAQFESVFTHEQAAIAKLQRANAKLNDQ